MRAFFDRARGEISAFLSSYLAERAESLSFIKPWGRDAVERLAAFALGGKLLRGGLAILGHAAYGGGRDRDALRCAAAMELFQSAFLIHDDIMDRDESRRGSPSLHFQYASLAAERGLADPRHQGEALGICGGDMAAFLGFELLAVDGAPPDYLGFCARELAAVCAAQMQDVVYGAGGGMPSEEEILALYAHKTGRYSFSLPLMAGAMLSGAGGPDLAALSRLGELMGTVFQIRDDEIGLYGDERVTGKPVGSDLRGGKKTLLMRSLMEALGPEGAARVSGLLGSPRTGAAELLEMRSLLDASGARERVRGIAAGLASEAAGIVASLRVSAERREDLTWLLDFCSGRDA